MSRRPVKYYSAKRRAIYAQGENVISLEVFERDNWICVICMEPIDPLRRYPDQACATIDHLLPLSKGGQHTYANCFAAHLMCNLKKDDNLLSDFQVW